MVSSRLTTIAKTGRRTEMSERIMSRRSRWPPAATASSCPARAPARRRADSACHRSTTPSSALRPCRTSTSPGRRRPILISRLCALPSATTNTKCCSFSGTIACSGSISAWPSERTSFTVMNMPGRRRPSRLSISARIATERVVGSTRVSMLVDAAVERGVADTRCCALATVKPGLQRGEKLLRHGEVELDDAEIVERRDDGARVHEAAEAHIAQTDAAVERRSDDAIVEPRARGGDARFVGEQRRLQLIELRFRQRLGLRTAPGCACIDCGCRWRRLRLRPDRRAPRCCRARSARRPCGPAGPR